MVLPQFFYYAPYLYIHFFLLLVLYTVGCGVWYIRYSGYITLATEHALYIACCIFGFVINKLVKQQMDKHLKKSGQNKRKNWKMAITHSKKYFEALDIIFFILMILSIIHYLYFDSNWFIFIVAQMWPLCIIYSYYYYL